MRHKLLTTSTLVHVCSHANMQFLHFFPHLIPLAQNL
uniref:Uncharacterized protein n=1 Tax=Arundo donax TaxID=35708 RepID=A0A0A9CCD3_ARUDO